MVSPAKSTIMRHSSHWYVGSRSPATVSSPDGASRRPHLGQATNPASAMKALSVKPIWAGLIEAGLKTIEVRSRNTHYRGPLLICTSKRPAEASVPGGVTLCIVDLVDSRPMTLADEAAAGVECLPGRWAWVLENVRSVERVRVKGQLSFFQVSAELIQPLRRTA